MKAKEAAWTAVGIIGTLMLFGFALFAAVMKVIAYYQIAVHGCGT